VQVYLFDTKMIALVTGASRGIGYAIAQSLASSGYKSILIAKTPERLSIAQKTIPNSSAIAFDLANLNNIQDLFTKIKATEEELGGTVSVLINAAGIVRNRLLISSKSHDLVAMTNTNLIAPIMLSQYVLRNMIRSRTGNIINISSIVGHKLGVRGLSEYSATKSGLVGFTKSLAKEVGEKGVRVNAIAPGYVKTDMVNGLDEKDLNIPLGRFASPEEVAAAVDYILKSQYLTGQCLVLDGGLS
jgi:NAD(P)-dependent dehydrogenase (short-subunit alcohol dehydrogenase family)